MTEYWVGHVTTGRSQSDFERLCCTNPMRDSSCESSVVARRHEKTHTPAKKTRNWPAYNEALKRRGSLTIWFDPAMIWEAAPTGKRGRQPDYSGETDQKTAPGGSFSRRTRKHGGTKRRVWRKIHIGIDAQTLEIRAAEFTTSGVGDAPMLPELLDQIAPDHEIASVTADGVFDNRKCHGAIAARGAAAVIPPRKNAKPWKPDTAGAIERNGALRASKRFGRTIWQRWSGYHRQSRVETKMHCLKLLGQRLMARDFDRQVAVPGPRCRPEWLHSTRHTRHRRRWISMSGDGDSRPSPELCNRAVLG